MGKIASSIYHRLEQRYGGTCNPSSSAETEEVEVPCQSSLTIPQYRMEVPRDAKGIIFIQQALHSVPHIGRQIADAFASVFMCLFAIVNCNHTI